MRGILSYTAIIIFYAFVSSWGTIINIPGDYSTIQQGIDASVDGDTVLVQPGTYYENINFNGHNIVLGSLFLTTGDTSYIEQTAVDGGLLESVIIFQNGEDSTAVLMGFKIIRGSAYRGGGVSCFNTSSIISHNIITNNLAKFGAGIHAQNSNSQILDNIIYNNSATYDIFEGYGGGIYCYYNANLLIKNNIIINNYATGGYFGAGGGISNLSNLKPVISNNVIAHNHIGGGYGGLGSGVYSENSIDIFNNTIVDNTIFGGMFPSEGGGIYCFDSSSIICNNILWNNSFSDLGGPIIASYCNVQDTLWPGIGNISIDPQFRDTANGDFHLMAIACGDSLDSPCIDVGDPNILDSLLDCSWGLGGWRSDMGAYGGGDSAMVGIVNNTPLPGKFSLMQNYPNPFNAQTTIRFFLAESQNVRLTVYDLRGRQVRTLLDERKRAGVHTTTFDASPLSSGVYFYRLQAGDEVETKTMVLLK